jgi:hypothetical protein
VRTILAVQGELPDPSIVGPGMAGFITFLALIVAAVFLFKSLNKQIKRVDFPEEGSDVDVTDAVDSQGPSQS